MPLSKELKEILVCPQCKGELEFHEEQNQIHCLRCKLAYAIQDNIPVMLIEEAKRLS